jgi:Zn-dependent M28 family amino/carboxypeptidase
MIEDLLAQVSSDRIRDHIRQLEGVRHPTVAPEALEQAAEYINDRLAAWDYPVAPHSFTFRGQEFRNIVATRSGVRQPEERVLVVAHYDTVEESPGANDNGSGVAVLLEAARVLQPAVFDRTVQFVSVNLEERQRQGPLEVAGLFGSRALAQEARAQGWQIEGVLVLETIACAGQDIEQKSPKGLPTPLPEVGDFIGVVGNEDSRALVTAFLGATARYEIPLPVVPLVVPGRGEMVPDTRRSDHSPFWDEGYPALMITDTANFRSPHYHQPTDTLDRLNLDFAANVCRALVGTVGEIASGGTA